MDVKAFSEENFDPVNWINTTFGGPESASTNKESFASSMVYKLQLFVQEINSSLEETAQQVIHNLPKVVRETETICRDASLLKGEMRALKEEIVKIQQQSSKPIQTIRAIDLVKNRMQEFSKALKEADNWTTLSSDVENVFVSGDIHAIAVKLVGMHKSLETLKDVPDYEDRVHQLEELKDRYQVIIKPHLVQAFSLNSLESAYRFVQTFKDLKRIPQLKKVYHDSIKNQLLEEWNRITKIDLQESLLEWLSNFFDMLASAWHIQMNFCLHVMYPDDFSSSVDVLCELFIDVIENLEPSLSQCLSQHLQLWQRKSYKHSSDCLKEIKQIIDRLAQSLEMNIMSSKDHKAILKKPQIQLLAETLYSFYKESIQNLSVTESEILKEDLNDIIKTCQLNDSVINVFVVAKESEKRNHFLTNSAAIPSLLVALDFFFEQYIYHLKQITSAMKKKCEESHDSSLPDWSLLQSTLFHFQSIGTLLIQLELFQEQLSNTINYISKKISTVESNPFQRFDQLFLTMEMKSELSTLINAIETEKSFVLLKNVNDEFEKLCVEAGSLIISAALKNVKIHLEDLEKKITTNEQDTDSNDEVLDFSLSPQEYITQIGQYILTIPQHIEPFVVIENSAFRLALKKAKLAASNLIETDNIAEVLLEIIIQKTMQLYTEKIADIQQLNKFAKRQLITDMNYLCDVIGDLGLTAGEELSLILNLLKSSDSHINLRECLAITENNIER